MILEWDCVASGGTVHPEYEFCMPNPCSGGGACCLEDGTCINSQAPFCQAMDGIFHAGVQCGVDPCGWVGACCLPSGACHRITSEHCTAQSGSWLGEGVDCEPNPCESSPIERTTWGRIKQSYR